VDVSKKEARNFCTVYDRGDAVGISGCFKEGGNVSNQSTSCDRTKASKFGRAFSLLL